MFQNETKQQSIQTKCLNNGYLEYDVTDLNAYRTYQIIINYNLNSSSLSSGPFLLQGQTKPASKFLLVLFNVQTIIVIVPLCRRRTCSKYRMSSFLPYRRCCCHTLQSKLKNLWSSWKWKNKRRLQKVPKFDENGPGFNFQLISQEVSMNSSIPRFNINQKLKSVTNFFVTCENDIGKCSTVVSMKINWKLKR